MSWSIGRAAKETGVSKSTLSRAIKAGKISAARQDDGSYLIDPAELFRVYPRRVAQPDAEAAHDAVRNPPEEVPATPSVETEILRIKLDMTEKMLARERETVEDLRKRLDTATGRVLELTKVAQPVAEPKDDALRNPPEAVAKRSIWDRIRGR